MKGLVILDPEAPGGRRRVHYGPVVGGRPLRSPAMRKLVEGLVRDAQKAAREAELMEEWVQSQLATAPPLTTIQTQMLRRAKGELIKAAQAKKAHGV